MKDLAMGMLTGMIITAMALVTAYLSYLNGYKNGLRDFPKKLNRPMISCKSNDT